MSDDPKLPAVPPTPDFLTDDLVRKIAMDVGKEVVEYIEWMYPKMFEAVAKSAKSSVRHCVYNRLMEAVKAANEGRVEQMLDFHDRHRRKMRQIRRSKTLEEVCATIDDDKIEL
jgi:hypothetical protein